MVGVHHISIGVLILQIYVNAAPNVDQPITEVKEAIIEVNEQSKTDSEKPTDLNENNSTQSQRQKRFYDFYGFPPLNPGYPANPGYYPGFNKRDQSGDIGTFGFDDHLTHIRRQLQDIANVARQPPPPPPPVHFPFYIPVLYIPQPGCNCNPQPQPQPQPTPKPNKNGTNVENRFPDLEDERQNWGLVVNETEADYDDDDYSRPISFDPIVSKRPMMRPPPPVDHGSRQGDSQNQPQSTTTVRPAATENPPRGRPPQIPVAAGAPFSQSFSPPDGQPTTCDGAVLSCCHQAQITYECFSLQGCPDPTAYGNPCDPLVILRIIDKYQKFYGRKN